MAWTSLKTRRRPYTAISAEDLDRLHAACEKGVDPTRSMFGSDSLTWRVNREAVLLLGGGCALLMQVAHPLVAAGVAAHSNFRTEPIKRLWRTLELMLTIVFAPAADAVRAVRTIEAVHSRVHGKLKKAIGPFPRGTPYNANDPELLFWVHATLVDTALRVYEMFIGPLTTAERTAYYEESKVTARLFGIPTALIPRTMRHFEHYMHEMIDGDVLAVSEASRDIAASIIEPPLPIGLKQVFQMPHLLTIGLLPEVLRERYGYRWGAAREVLLGVTVTATQSVLPWLPAAVRTLPQARAGANPSR